MKKIILAALFSAFLVAGCASQIMKQYVGKDIRQAYLEHGMVIVSCYHRGLRN